MVRHLFRHLLASVTALIATTALAEFHTFQIEQIYSNADGSFQYVVLHESQGMNGESLWTGQMFTAIHGGAAKIFVFRSDLPGGNGYLGVPAPTANKRVLIASQGFAALNLIVPDYVIPNGFIATNGATLDYAGVDQVTFSSLPIDGTHALDRNGMVVPAVASNFGGYSVPVGPAASTPNFQGLWYASPAESEAGWGINFAHQGDTIFASWFTYDLTGKGWWLVMTTNKTAPNVYGGTISQVTMGPAFDAVPFPPVGSPGGATGASVGGAILAFLDANNGLFEYTVNGVAQTKPITRQQFGPMPACTFGAQMNLALATNYTDLWWAAPAGSQSGWGINFTHQGDTIFATWFTYDHDHTPMWLVVTATKTAPGTYTGPLLRTIGPPFNTVPFPPVGMPGGVTGSPVGTATFTFTDGNNATFAYTVNGVSQSKVITREVFQPPGTTCQ